MLCVLLAAFVLTDPAPPVSRAKRHAEAVAEAAKAYLDGWEPAEHSARNMAPDRAKSYLAGVHLELVHAYTRDNGVTPKELQKAVAELQKARAAAKPAAKPAAPGPAGPSTADERIAAAKPGALGTLEKDAYVANDFLVISDAAVLRIAGDRRGMAKYVVAKRARLNDAPAQVRVIEVHDFRAIGKGLFCRVRVNEGPYRDKEAFVFPEDVDFGPKP